MQTQNVNGAADNACILKKLPFPVGWREDWKASVGRISTKYPRVVPRMEMFAEFHQKCESEDEGDSSDEEGGLFMKCTRKPYHTSTDGTNELPKLSHKKEKAISGTLRMDIPPIVVHDDNTPPDSNVYPGLAEVSSLSTSLQKKLPCARRVNAPPTPEQSVDAGSGGQLLLDRPVHQTQEWKDDTLYPQNTHPDAELAKSYYPEVHSYLDGEPEITQIGEFAMVLEQKVNGMHDFAEAYPIAPPSDQSDASASSPQSNYIVGDEGKLEQRPVTKTHPELPKSTRTNNAAPARRARPKVATASYMFETPKGPIIQEGFDCPAGNFDQENFSPTNNRRRIELVMSWTAWPRIYGYNFYEEPPSFEPSYW